MNRQKNQIALFVVAFGLCLTFSNCESSEEEFWNGTEVRTRSGMYMGALEPDPENYPISVTAGCDSITCTKHIKHDDHKDTVVVRINYQWNSFDYGESAKQAGLTAACSILSVNHSPNPLGYGSAIEIKSLEGLRVISELKISRTDLPKPVPFTVYYNIQAD